MSSLVLSLSYLGVDHGHEVILRDDADAHLVEQRAVQRSRPDRELAVALRDAGGREAYGRRPAHRPR